MSEVFFILTTVFVAYVVFSVVSDEKKTEPKNSPAKKGTAKAATPAAPEAIKPKESLVTEKKAEAVTKKEESTAATNDTLDATDDENSLRNPETGEVAKIPNNYRFSKRWIKEALVKEGLLDKIYKNNELDDETNAKIKQALADLQAIEKYQA